MPVKPFKLALKKSEKDKSKIELPREAGGRLWAECTPNIGGQWGFKGDDFGFKILWATGIIDSAQHKWLVGAFEGWNDLFEIHHKKVEGKDERGYPKYVPNPEEEALTKQWEEGGQLTALCVDTIPQLEWLVEFAQNRIIFNHAGYKVYLKNAPKKETFDKVAASIAEAKDSGYDFNLMKHGKDPVFAEFKKENSWFFCGVEEDLYNTDAVVEYMKLDSILDDVLLLEFKDGFLTSVKVEGWSAPEVKISSGGGFGSGAKGQTESEILKDRVAFILKELGVSSLMEVSDEYGRKLCPIHVDLILSIASRSNWTNNHYTLGKPSLEGYSLANGIDSKLLSQNDSGIFSQRKDAPTTTSQSETEGEKSDESKDVGELYLPKVIALLDDPEKSFPAEINIEFLRNQDEEWLEHFYMFSTGAIITSQGNKQPFTKGQTRAINTWVKMRVPESQGIATLTTSQLASLLSHRDFVRPTYDSLPL